MGCGGSKQGGSKPSRRTKVEDYEDGYNRRPKVSIRIGEQVKRCLASPRIVFIFGGPGSRKGCIVDDLITAYNLQHICTEDILYKELPKRLANVIKIEDVSSMKDALENDPSHVTMDWLLEIIGQKITDNPNANFLIDFIPNLKYMLRAQFLQENIAEKLLKFEEKHPISFGLNLAIPTDKVIGAKQVYCAAPANDSNHLKESGGKGDEADAAKLQLISAEFDTDMLKRRAALYEQSSRSLLDYFRSTDRLVTVDVTCGVSELIWHQVHTLFCDLDFAPCRTVNTVLLFVFDENDINGFDYQRYHMEAIDLHDIVENPDASVENTLQELAKYVDKNSQTTDSFVIKTSRKVLSNQSLRKLSERMIVFTDITEGYLESFLPGSPKNFQPRSGSHKYKAVSSLENELCLFPLDTSDDVCIAIALHMARFRCF